MKTWHLEEFGRENLHIEDVLRPEPGPDQILVRTNAVSLNSRDKAIINGSYHDPVSFPLVPGSDLAGEVVSIGTKVTQFKPGDQVVSVFKPLWVDGVPTADNQATLGSPLPGVLSEYVLLSEGGALIYPNYLTPAQASTLPVAAVTAWVGLFEAGVLTPGKTVLIQGSGGVSLFGLQLAIAYGSRVIAISRSVSKLPMLTQLGASDVIDTVRHPSWEDEVMTLTGGMGADFTLEVLGGDSVQQSIAASASGGHIAIIGYMESTAATISIPSLLGKQVNLQGISVGSRKHMSNLLSFLEKHRIQPVVDATYDLSALPQALDHLARGPFGKVVLEVH